MSTFFPYQAAMWLGVSAYHVGCLATRWWSEPVSPGWMIAEFACGLAVSRGLWIATEYIGHRYLLHGPLYEIHHKYHHDSPIDDKHMFISPLYTVPVSYVYYETMQLCVGTNVTVVLWIFIPLHYLAFEWLHWQTHQPITNKHSVLYMVKQYHKSHHINPKINYGITSPSGDFIGNTLEE